LCLTAKTIDGFGEVNPNCGHLQKKELLPGESAHQARLTWKLEKFCFHFFGKLASISRVACPKNQQIKSSVSPINQESGYSLPENLSAFLPLKTACTPT
jgi:hypothetical protein